MAIGNNAKFVIDRGGKFVIDETCQLEIEWDGATTTPAAEGSTTPATPTTPDILNNGLLDLRAGGEIVNNGIITIEGTEGKPYAADQQPTETEKGCGEMTINEGATLTNNGSMVVNGKLYNLGTLVNNGSYDELIESNDPDKGVFAYHRGIQVAWKDDVTQQNVVPGTLYNGVDRDGTLHPDAVIRNSGDIVMAPGTLENDALIKNRGIIFLATVTDAIIPIEPTAEAPTVTTKRVTLDPPVGSHLVNNGRIEIYGLNNYYDRILPASMEINDNGSFGMLTIPGDHPELFDITGTGEIVKIPIYRRLSNKGFVAEVQESSHKATAQTEDDLLTSVKLEDGTWLYLYKDKSFLMRLPGGEEIKGIYDIIDGNLVFVPTSGEVVNPTAADGGYAYAITRANGEPFNFTLTEDFVAQVRAAQ